MIRKFLTAADIVTTIVPAIMAALVILAISLNTLTVQTAR